MSRRLSTEEAADYLGVKERTVRLLIERRAIPFTKIGRLIRFDTADLDAYLQANRVEAQK